MVQLVKITQLTTVVDAHMDTQEATVENLLIGAALILVKIKLPVAKLKISISVYVVQDGRVKCAMLKWSVVKMLQPEKVCNLNVVKNTH